MLLGLAAGAGATLGRPILSRLLHGSAPAASRPSPARREDHAPRPGSFGAIPLAPTVDPAVGTTGNAFDPVAPPVLGGSSDPAASIGGARAGSPEVALVVDGVNALRRDRDPRRAGALFDRYLDRYPDGILVEEVLVLAI
jgi:hypothetical protein